MGEPPVTITGVASLDDLSPAAQALFGQDAFSTLAWYRSTVSVGLDDGARACFQVAASGGRVLAVLPMLRRAGRLSALATPYTCLWQPLLASGLSTAVLTEIGRALAKLWRRHGVVRLEAMAADAPGWAAILDGLRGGGMRPLGFEHFGNWHLDVTGIGWGGYLASRPGLLRSAIKRPSRRLLQTNNAVFTLVQGGADLEPAIAAYETVYAASWKQPEPRPLFNATLMRACAAGGTLRLGIMTMAGAPIAVQFWLVHAGWAGVLKLAHDEAHKALAPGTVLTGLMIRHLLDVEHVRELDFGRGDDEYKQLWTSARRQRVGFLVVNPLLPSGMLEVARHAGSRVWRAMGAVGRRVRGEGGGPVAHTCIGRFSRLYSVSRAL